MDSSQSVLGKVLGLVGTLLSAWGGAVAGAALGLFAGGLLGPLLASVDMGLLLGKMAEYLGLPPGAVWLIEFALNWIPFFSVAKAIVGLLTGWLGGMGLGAVLGAGVGLIVVLVSSFGSKGKSLVAAPVAERLLGSRLDFLFQGALSMWWGNLTLRNSVGVVLGVLGAEWIRYWSAHLPFDHYGPEYMVSLVFGVFTVGVLGAVVGYSVAALCLTLQRHAPWALAGTAPGVVIAQALGATDPVPFYSWAITGALVGHVLSLVIGPLRGKLSLGREGSLVGIVLGLLVLDSPGFAFFSASGCLLLGRFVSLGSVAPAVATSAVTATTGVSVLPGAVGIVWWPLILNVRSFVGGFGGFFVGGFIGHPGGLLPWLVLGGALAHFGALQARWAAAGVQAQAYAAGNLALVPAGAGGVGVASGAVSWSGVVGSGSGVGSAALGAGAAGSAGATAGLGGMKLLGMLLGCLSLGLAGLSGLAALAATEARPSLAARFGFERGVEPARLPSTSPLSGRGGARPSTGVAPTSTAPRTPRSPDPTSAPTPTPAAPTAAPNAAAAPAAAAPPADSALLLLLRSYYSDLNAGTFDANRYFEPAVERYITMQGTSTAAMNNYIQKIFPKQFKEHHFELVEGSLVAEGGNEFRYTEASRYFQVAKKRVVAQECSVRIRVSPNGKLTFLQQFGRKELPVPAASSSPPGTPQPAR